MWIVITGAPSSGKTTLVEALQREGYTVVPESAREVLSGSGLDESGADVQTMIEALQMRKEASLASDQDCVLDRALPDSLAYRRLGGIPELALRKAVDARRYGLVFLCQFGQHIPDGLRKDDQVRAIELERLLRDVYHELGCPVVELPWVSGLPQAEAVALRLSLVRENLAAPTNGTRKIPPSG